MTPEQLARMRNPLNHNNLDRIRRLLGKIEFCIATRSRNSLETKDWFYEIGDELCGCRAILIEECRRRKGHDGGERAEFAKKRKEQNRLKRKYGRRACK